MLSCRFIAQPHSPLEVSDAGHLDVASAWLLQVLLLDHGLYRMSTVRRRHVT